MPLDKSKQKRLAEILLLATRVQYETGYCVFVTFSGHVDKLEISVRKNRERYETMIFEQRVSLMPYAFMTEHEREAFEKDLTQDLTVIKKSLLSLIDSEKTKNQMN